MPPPGYGQAPPPQAPPPGYGQAPPPPPPGYWQPAAALPQRNNKKLFIIIAIAAAAAVIALLLALNLGDRPGKKVDPGEGGDDVFFILESYFEKPPGRELPPFEMGEPGFYTDDPNIKMIEVNQALSYGYNTDTGEFYLLESIVAGKETGIFAVMEKPVDPASEITLTVV